MNNIITHEVIPGILEKEWSEIERKILLVKDFAKTIHIDIIDGKFAPNTTFMDPTPFAKYSSDIFFELHLMVEEPINFLKPFADVGFKRFLGHIEKMSDPFDFVAQGQLLGEVGLFIDGPTSVEALTVAVDDVDVIGIFTAAKAGASGQPFEPSVLKKVRAIRAKSPTIPIEVDGGTNDETTLQSCQAGATRFVATSFLYKSDNPYAQFQTLQSCLTHY